MSLTRIDLNTIGIRAQDLTTGPVQDSVSVKTEAYLYSILCITFTRQKFESHLGWYVLHTQNAQLNRQKPPNPPNPTWPAKLHLARQNAPSPPKCTWPAKLHLARQIAPGPRKPTWPVKIHFLDYPDDCLSRLPPSVTRRTIFSQGVGGILGVFECVNRKHRVLNTA